MDSRRKPEKNRKTLLGAVIHFLSSYKTFHTYIPLKNRQAKPIFVSACQKKPQARAMEQSSQLLVRSFTYGGACVRGAKVRKIQKETTNEELNLFHSHSRCGQYRNNNALSEKFSFNMIFILSKARKIPLKYQKT